MGGSNNMKKPVLVVMAAGMGSRYGGLKQIDPIDKDGDIIIDFSIYDAIQAGFEKIVFIIKKENEADFRAAIGDRMSKHIQVEFVFQDLHNLPEGFTVPEGRVKPWGTGHAIMSCIDVIDGPFAVINADDYYGKEAFKKVHDYLVGEGTTGKEYDMCMAGFILKNTLSDNGAVTRGVCVVDENDYLAEVVETGGLMMTPEGTIAHEENGSDMVITPDQHVSMNMWGFTPDYFEYSEEFFKEFLKANMGNLKSEYFIPLMVNKLITEGTARVKVLDTTSKWFGVTYAADRQGVVDKIQALVDAGEYPSKLF